MASTETNAKFKPKDIQSTMPLKKSSKHDLFPEVKFCNLSASDEPAANESLLKHCLITVDKVDGIQTRKRKKVGLHKSDDSIDTGSTDKKKPEIPDGGYGWIIVGASLVVSLIADGLGFSFGLINTELLDYFGESPSKTAWISSLFFSVPLLMGPIWSNLVDNYGCRKMTIFGGLLSATGFGLSSLCNSVEMLMLTFGIISGLGLGIGYVTVIVSIAFWFDKKRTFAAGIAASGTGIGTLLYAPLTQWLLNSYGWRGATLILAGTMLNTCVCGALMRDPDWLMEENRLESRSQSISTFSNSSVRLQEIKKLLETGATKEAVLISLLTKNNTKSNQKITDPHEFVIKRFHSEVFLPTFLGSQHWDSTYEVKSLSRPSLRHKDAVEAPSPENLLLMSAAAANPTVAIIDSTDDSIMEGISDIAADEQPTFATLKPNDLRRSAACLISLKNNILPVIDGSSRKQNYETTAIPNSENYEANKSTTRTRADSIISNCRSSKSKKANARPNFIARNSNFLQNIRMHRNSIHCRVAMLNTHRYRLRASSCPNIYRNSMTTIAEEKEDTWYESLVGAMKTIFDFSLFADVKFTLFNISTLFLFAWFVIPYLFLPEYMKIHGYETAASAQLISVIGIAQTVGMLGLGYVGDRPWMNVNVCYSACMVVCGISVLLMPFLASTYSLLLLMCVIFGFTFASSFSFTPSICVSIVDLDDFTCAYGLVLLVQGVGMIAGPPIAGAIYEVTLSWDYSFYFAGVFIVLSGVASYLIEFCEKQEISDASAAKRAQLVH